MNLYLNKAHKLFRLSKKELNEAKKINDEELARDASGKAWIATTDALRGFLLSRGLSERKLPKSERQRHDFLAQFGDEKMWQLYYAISGEIHQTAYYEGIINYTHLFVAFNNVNKFIRFCGN